MRYVLKYSEKLTEKYNLIGTIMYMYIEIITVRERDDCDCDANLNSLFNAAKSESLIFNNRMVIFT